jgi:nucleosome assembly protein 1-like 1
MANRRNRRVEESDDDDDDDENEEEINGGEFDVDGIDDDEDDLAHLPPYVLPRVDKLRKLNDQRDEIMETYLLERAALEKKFEQLYQPMYLERAKIINGEKDDEIEQEAKQAANSSDPHATGDENNNNINEPRIRGIPQFWATAMARMDALSELICEEDVDCLEHLLDVRCITRDDGKGFTLEFHFDPANRYFTNTILTKEYEVPNLFSPEEPVLKNVIGTKINWKPNMCLTRRVVKKKQRGKGKNAGRVRTVEKSEEKDSFFNWFDPPKMPSTMDDIDEEEADRLEEIFDSDFEIAETLRTEVIPKALLWFTNQAEDGDDEDDAAEVAAALAAAGESDQ